jgi:hypothetical protein
LLDTDNRLLLFTITNRQKIFSAHQINTLEPSQPHLGFVSANPSATFPVKNRGGLIAAPGRLSGSNPDPASRECRNGCVFPTGPDSFGNHPFGKGHRLTTDERLRQRTVRAFVPPRQGWPIGPYCEYASLITTARPEGARPRRAETNVTTARQIRMGKLRR